MGVPGLLKSLGGGTEGDVFVFGAGRRAAIDASVWMHEFAASRAEDVVARKSYGVIATLYVARVELLARHGISTISVFDGPDPYGPKDATREVREAKREEALRELEARNGDPTLTEADRLRLLKRAIRIVPEVVAAVIRALRSRGHPTIVAPREADAQLAALTLEGVADFVITVDQDLIVHDATRIVTNVDYSCGRCTLFSLGREPCRDADPWTATSTALDLIAPYPPVMRVVLLRMLAALSGCDYLKFNGVAEKGALKLLQKACAGVVGMRRPPTPAEVVATYGAPLATESCADGASLTAADAARAISHCCDAFAHAPAFSVRLRRYTAVSAIRGELSELAATAAAAELGVDLTALNAENDVTRTARVMGFAAAPAVPYTEPPPPPWLWLPRDGDPFVLYRVPALVPGAHASFLYTAGNGDVAACKAEDLKFFLQARNVRAISAASKPELLVLVQSTIARERFSIEKEVLVTNPREKESGQLYRHLYALGRRDGEGNADGQEMRWLNPDLRPPPANGPQKWIYFDHDKRVFLDELPALSRPTILTTFRRRGDSEHMKPIRHGDALVEQTEKLLNLRWCRGTRAAASGPPGRFRREDWVSCSVPASYAAKYYETSVLLLCEWDEAHHEEPLPAGWSGARPVVARVVHACCSDSCVAGLSGLCWHVAYVLVAVSKFTTPVVPAAASGAGELSSTSLPCVWSNPGKATDTALQPTASSSRAKKRPGPNRHSHWYSSPEMLRLLGRQSTDGRSEAARSQTRDDPPRVAAREHFYAAVRKYNNGQACAAEVMFDTPVAEVRAWVDEAAARRKRRRDSDGAEVPLPWQPLSWKSRGGPDADGAEVLASAAAAAAPLRQHYRPFVMAHPGVRLPGGDAAVSELHHADPRMTVFCWWHGFRKRADHMEAGTCRWLSTDAGKEALATFRRRFKVPVAGQSFNDVNPSRKGAWKKGGPAPAGAGPRRRPAH